MPLYEYYCAVCDKKFEMLRPMSKATDPVACPAGHSDAERVISVFSALSANAEGELTSVAGSNACSTCATGDCASCSI